MANREVIEFVKSQGFSLKDSKAIVETFLDLQSTGKLNTQLIILARLFLKGKSSAFDEVRKEM